MIAVDTNILVYSHREDSSFHESALAAVRGLAESSSLWAIPWPVIHEFLAVVTHPRIYSPPTPLDDAILQVRRWMESPSFTAIAETGAIYFDYLQHVLGAALTVGARVHDARIVAVCLAHGVEELWSADRDFSRFPGLTVRNPLVT